MLKSQTIRGLMMTGAATLALVSGAQATVFDGTLFYTNFTGGPNVNKIDYSYDDATNAFSLTNQANVASTNGADGIIFAPNGNLLIGGQGSGNVYEVSPTTGAVLDTQATGAASYHLTLRAGKIYTSDFGGALKTLDFPMTTTTTTAITGDDDGVTQIAFDDIGASYYVNGNPNGGGNIGTIDLATGVTTQLHVGVESAHGMIYDPFTDLITLFGAGKTGTLDSEGVLKQAAADFACDFDQGAVDGLGHALVAGCGSITFIDYSLSSDITAPDFFTVVTGFGGIDDVAPLVGEGSQTGTVPEPTTLGLLAAGLLGLRSLRRKAP